MGRNSSASYREFMKSWYLLILAVVAAKLLDETGSNLDYANEMAAKACADLQ